MLQAMDELDVQEKPGTREGTPGAIAERALKQKRHARAPNVRVAEFIAKPGKIRELKDCLRGPVTNLLSEITGFSETILLHSLKESRRLLILTVWETEDQAADNCWEELSAVRKLVSPLIDVCAKVHTYEASFSEALEQASLPGPTDMLNCTQSRAVSLPPAGAK